MRGTSLVEVDIGKVRSVIVEVIVIVQRISKDVVKN